MAFQKLTDILLQVQGRYPALNKRLREAEALARWNLAVGSIIAKHSRAIRIENRVLWVEVDHPIWKAELHHRKRQILDLLNTHTPAGKPAPATVEEAPLDDILFLDPRSARNPAKIR